MLEVEVCWASTSMVYRSKNGNEVLRENPSSASWRLDQTFRFGPFAEMQTAARSERCIQSLMLSKRTQIESWLKIMAHESSFRGLRGRQQGTCKSLLQR